MTTDAYLVAALAVALTGISKSGFAGGLGILGVPLVALTMPVQEAAVLLLPVLVGIDLLSVWRYRRAWQARLVLVLLPGAALGIVLGMVGFSQVDPDGLRLAIGVMALVFVARFVWRGPDTAPVTAAPRAVVFLASLLSGFAGFVAHAGGPPIKGTFLRMNLDKSAFVGTNAVFFFVLNMAKGFGYGALGLLTTEGLWASALLVPFLLIGVGLGMALHDRIPQALFVRLAYGLLALAGLNLVVLGGASLWAGAS
ncbi:sulfite exporter TauE/SafE family protein [Tropicimonas sp. S265A]|uniref:sulfite exporter TauE/SafE family protein n=1 Tax=Tropicimonas sp. S265A TaxID=3415134 RepID=UPI003C79FC32